MFFIFCKKKPCCILYEEVVTIKSTKQLSSLKSLVELFLNCSSGIEIIESSLQQLVEQQRLAIDSSNISLLALLQH